MESAKNDLREWYAVGWISNGEKNIDSLEWETERDARIYAMILFERIGGEDCQTFYARISFKDDFNVYNGSWHIMKRRGE